MLTQKKTRNTKAREHKRTKTSNKKTQLRTELPTTLQGTTNLQHVCLAFPTPRGIVHITIVNGTMQNLEAPFSL
jgi:hypothetical protein